VPLGISFFWYGIQRAHSDQLASGFEAATTIRAKNLPTFAPMTPYNNVQARIFGNRLAGGADAPKPDLDKRIPRHL